VGGEDDNAQIVRRALEGAVNGHDRGALDGLIGDPKVLAVFDVIDAYPDVELDVEWLVAGGPKVVTWLRLRGTHLGPWQGVEPTGRTVDVRVSLTFELLDGRLVDFWYAADTLDWYTQLGFELQAPTT
jgi:predicted ester cyclase